MQTTPFIDRVINLTRRNDSFLCIGLDVNEHYLPGVSVEQYLLGVIEATAEQVCAYKINPAYFHALTDCPNPIKLMGKLREAAANRGVPVIYDGKFGDVQHTNKAHARSVFEVGNYDAVTLNPLVGFTSLSPFYADRYADRYIFVWCYPSVGGGLLTYIRDTDLATLLIDSLIHTHRAGAVIGVGQPNGQDLLAMHRERNPSSLALVPGVGAQGGSVDEALSAPGSDHPRTLVTVSRAILYSNVRLIAGGTSAERLTRAVRAAALEAERFNDHLADALWTRAIGESTLQPVITTIEATVTKVTRD